MSVILNELPRLLAKDNEFGAVNITGIARLVVSSLHKPSREFLEVCFEYLDPSKIVQRMRICL